MQMKRILPIAALGLVALLVAPAAQAQDRDNRNVVHGFAGGLFYDLDGDFEDVDLGREFVLGGAYEYLASEHVGIELGTAFTPGSGRIGTSVADTGIDTWYLNGSLNFYLPITSHFRPFLTGGGGATLLDVDGGETEINPAVVFGGGIDIPLTQRLSVRTLARDQLTFYDGLDPATAEVLGLSPDFDDRVHDFQLVGGLSFVF